MQFLLLIYDREKRWTEMDQAEQNSQTEEFFAFGREYANAIRGGNALQPTPTSKTVRLLGGQMQVTDGPFAETKEQLGGYYLVEAGDIDEAVAMAARNPGSKYGSIEVRPIMTFS